MDDQIICCLSDYNFLLFFFSADLNFLEKIFLYSWKELQNFLNSTKSFAAHGNDLTKSQFHTVNDNGSKVLSSRRDSLNFDLTSFDLSKVNVTVISLAGDVFIQGTKVKALTHFPTVKLVGMNPLQNVGRWYYEVTLLSDGLMQIGWATGLFRCDPVCGQGVGDHIQSWAYDGLRSKKWNVSCEAYGKRWKQGKL
jgi:hypothetical protein